MQSGLVQTLLETPFMRKLAVIGTAGRDKSAPMTSQLWAAMTSDLQARLLPGDVLVSGGAAWADHLAVHAFLNGWCEALELYLPAPMVGGRYVGAFKTAGATAAYYHDRFSAVIGVDTQGQIAMAIESGASAEWEPVSFGARAMFARNAKIAREATAILAYTFGDGDEPLPGGTLDTWNKSEALEKEHVRLKTISVKSVSRERWVRQR